MSKIRRIIRIQSHEADTEKLIKEAYDTGWWDGAAEGERGAQDRAAKDVVTLMGFADEAQKLLYSGGRRAKTKLTERERKTIITDCLRALLEHAVNMPGVADLARHHIDVRPEDDEWDGDDEDEEDPIDISEMGQEPRRLTGRRGRRR